MVKQVKVPRKILWKDQNTQSKEKNKQPIFRNVAF